MAPRPSFSAVSAGKDKVQDALFNIADEVLDEKKEKPEEKEVIAKKTVPKRAQPTPTSAKRTVAAIGIKRTTTTSTISLTEQEKLAIDEAAMELRKAGESRAKASHVLRAAFHMFNQASVEKKIEAYQQIENLEARRAGTYR